MIYIFWSFSSHDRITKAQAMEAMEAMEVNMFAMRLFLSVCFHAVKNTQLALT